MPARRGGISVRHSVTARDTSGKYANAAYPQWMRLLEDKYQKLHQKIALATRLNSVRTRRIPQTARDGAASRRAYMASSASARFPSNVDIADYSDESHGNNAGSVSARNEKAGDAAPADEKTLPKIDVIAARSDANFGDGSKFQTELSRGSKFQTELNRASKFDTELKRGSKFENELKDDSAVQYNLNDGSRFQNELKDVFKFRTQSASLSEGHETPSDSAVKLMSRLDKKEGRERYPPNKLYVGVNTAHSRESHYTSRSCPALIQTLKKMGVPPRGSLTSSYQKGPLALRSLNMFSKMSSEAQHAVSETLMEMGVERSNSVTTSSSSALDLGDVSAAPIERPFTNINSRFLHTYAQRRRGLGTGTIRRERQHHHVVASNASTRSSNSNERSQRTRLPQLIHPTKTTSTRWKPGGFCIENIAAARHRIPALGKYDVSVFREPTFQITLPDFDIRYRDVLSSERCDSEIPPLEIREEAIKKCQEWLAKYTQR